MADSASINKIFSEYNELSQLAAEKRDKKIEDTYKKYPKLKEFDDEMNRLGMENIKNIIKNPQKNDEINKNYKEKIKNIEKEKEKYIKENNIDKNYNKYEYKCELCKDTGHTPDGKRCSCLTQKLIEINYNSSNIGKKMNDENFENFSFDYYSKEKENNVISPYENMQRVYNRARRFCDCFDSEYNNMLFYGAPGLGKTFLSSCIAKELIDKCKSVIYIRASKLFSTLEDNKFGRNRDEESVNNFYNCDLLIIDDLGTEAIMKNNNSYLFDIVDERLNRKKSIIINTNFDISDLTKIYTSRFTSRIMENFMICRFIGDDIRLKK